MNSNASSRRERSARVAPPSPAPRSRIATRSRYAASISRRLASCGTPRITCQVLPRSARLMRPCGAAAGAVAGAVAGGAAPSCTPMGTGGARCWRTTVMIQETSPQPIAAPPPITIQSVRLTRFSFQPPQLLTERRMRRAVLRQHPPRSAERFLKLRAQRRGRSPLEAERRQLRRGDRPAALRGDRAGQIARARQAHERHEDGREERQAGESELLPARGGESARRGRERAAQERRRDEQRLVPER